MICLKSAKFFEKVKVATCAMLVCANVGNVNVCILDKDSGEMAIKNAAQTVLQNPPTRTRGEKL